MSHYLRLGSGKIIALQGAGWRWVDNPAPLNIQEQQQSGDILDVVADKHGTELTKERR